MSVKKSDPEQPRDEGDKDDYAETRGKKKGGGGQCSDKSDARMIVPGFAEKIANSRRKMRRA